jgi:hypothetical protein
LIDVSLIANILGASTEAQCTESLLKTNYSNAPYFHITIQKISNKKNDESKPER